jgi:hypothetical protein
MLGYLGAATPQTTGLIRSSFLAFSHATPSPNTHSRGYEPIVFAGVLLACGVVALWRAILAICVVACVVLFFVGILVVASNMQNLFRHTSGEKVPAATLSHVKQLNDPC